MVATGTSSCPAGHFLHPVQQWSFKEFTVALRQFYKFYRAIGSTYLLAFTTRSMLYIAPDAGELLDLCISCVLVILGPLFDNVQLKFPPSPRTSQPRLRLGYQRGLECNPPSLCDPSLPDLAVCCFGPSKSLVQSQTTVSSCRPETRSSRTVASAVRKYPVTIDILAVRPLNKLELAILTEHANHIRHIVIHFSSYNLPTMFLSGIKTPFPKLEKLDWDIVRTDERFSVVKGPNRIMQPMSLPPTSQKMQLHCSEIRPNLFELWYLLAVNARTLEHFEHSGITPKAQSAQKYGIIQSTALKSLKLGIFDNVVPLLRFFKHSPVLQKLVLRDITICPKVASKPFYDALSYQLIDGNELFEVLAAQKTLMLTRLYLHGIQQAPGRVSTIQDYFYSLPALQNLLLYAINRDYFTALSPCSIDDPPLFLKLKQLLVSEAEDLLVYIGWRIHADYSMMQKVVLTSAAAESLIVEDKIALALHAHERCVIVRCSSLVFKRYICCNMYRLSIFE
ncbi:hypothetical protein C8J56DRAFT_1060707 [Mycena floridula]|nr:hypothetical protein C8J56DRAFT_1060707 [Mycena floridula]